MDLGELGSDLSVCGASPFSLFFSLAAGVAVVVVGLVNVAASRSGMAGVTEEEVPYTLSRHDMRLEWFWNGYSGIFFRKKNFIS